MGALFTSVLNTNNNACKAAKDYEEEFRPPMKQVSKLKYAYPVPPNKFKADMVEEFNAEQIDSHSTHVPDIYLYDSYEYLTTFLTQNCFSDLQKARALYIFVANIRFEVLDQLYTKLPRKNSPLDYLLKIAWKQANHANFFTQLCRVVGLQCVLVTGVAKNAGYELGDRIRRSLNGTQWNAVWIDDQWFLVDTLWGCSSIRGRSHDKWYPVDSDARVRRASKPYVVNDANESYFLVDPHILIHTHYPDDMEWQLLDDPLTLGEFEDLVLVKPRFYQVGLNFLPESKRSIHITCDKGEAEILFALDPTYRAQYHYILSRHTSEGQKENIDRYIFFTKIYDQMYFHITLPWLGKYKFEVYGKNPSAQHKKYALLCAYLLKCTGLKEKIETLPDNPSIGWGPGYEMTDLKVKPISHPEPKVDAPGGMLKMRFKTTKGYDVSLLPELRRDDISEDLLENCVLSHREGDFLVIDLRFPQDGTYGLLLHAEHHHTEEKEPQNVCNYLIHVPDGHSAEPFPALNGGLLGPTIYAENHGIEETFPHSVISAEEGQVQLEFESPADVELLCNINHRYLPSEVLASGVSSKVEEVHPTKADKHKRGARGKKLPPLAKKGHRFAGRKSISQASKHPPFGTSHSRLPGAIDEPAMDTMSNAQDPECSSQDSSVSSSMKGEDHHSGDKESKKDERRASHVTKHDCSKKPPLPHMTHHPIKGRKSISQAHKRPLGSRKPSHVESTIDSIPETEGTQDSHPAPGKCLPIEEELSSSNDRHKTNFSINFPAEGDYAVNVYARAKDDPNRLFHAHSSLVNAEKAGDPTLLEKAGLGEEELAELKAKAAAHEKKRKSSTPSKRSSDLTAVSSDTSLISSHSDFHRLNSISDKRRPTLTLEQKLSVGSYKSRSLSRRSAAGSSETKAADAGSTDTDKMPLLRDIEGTPIDPTKSQEREMEEGRMTSTHGSSVDPVTSQEAKMSEGTETPGLGTSVDAITTSRSASAGEPAGSALLISGPGTAHGLGDHPFQEELVTDHDFVEIRVPAEDGKLGVELLHNGINVMDKDQVEITQDGEEQVVIVKMPELGNYNVNVYNEKDACTAIKGSYQVKRKAPSGKRRRKPRGRGKQNVSKRGKKLPKDDKPEFGDYKSPYGQSGYSSSSSRKQVPKYPRRKPIVAASTIPKAVKVKKRSSKVSAAPTETEPKVKKHRESSVASKKSSKEVTEKVPADKDEEEDEEEEEQGSEDGEVEVEGEEDNQPTVKRSSPKQNRTRAESENSRPGSPPIQKEVITYVIKQALASILRPLSTEPQANGKAPEKQANGKAPKSFSSIISHTRRSQSRSPSRPLSRSSSRPARPPSAPGRQQSGAYTPELSTLAPHHHGTTSTTSTGQSLDHRETRRHGSMAKYWADTEASAHRVAATRQSHRDSDFKYISGVPLSRKRSKSLSPLRRRPSSASGRPNFLRLSHPLRASRCSQSSQGHHEYDPEITRDRYIDAMVKAMHAGNQEELAKYIRLFEKHGFKDTAQFSLQNAKRHMDFWRIREGLQRAIDSRHIETLDKAIDESDRADPEVKPKLSLIHDQAVLTRDTLVKMKKLRATVLNLDQRTIAEMKSFTKPPEPVVMVMRAVFILLGEPEEDVKTWKLTQKKLGKLGRDGLKKLVAEFQDIDKLDVKRAKKAKKMLSKYKTEQLRGYSAVSATFHEWALGMIEAAWLNAHSNEPRPEVEAGAEEEEEEEEESGAEDENEPGADDEPEEDEEMM